MAQQGDTPAMAFRYSTAALLGSVGGDTGNPGAAAPGFSDNTDVTSLLKELPNVSQDDLESIVIAADSKVSSRRLGGKVASANLKPMYHKGTNALIVPRTFVEADNYLGLYTVKAALKLGYNVKTIPYAGDCAELPTDLEQINLGIYMSLDDHESLFKFTKKIDNYERGRTYARSQQVLGALMSNGMDASVLKQNHTFFGNFRPEKGADEKDKKSKDLYWIHMLPQLIKETDLRDSCTKVILHVMRNTWSLVDGEILWTNMVPNFVPYGTVIKDTCSKDVVIEPAKGKKAAVTKAKVPTKVRSNALLLKGELEYINTVSGPLFEPTPWEKLSQEEWVKAIWANGLGKIKKELSTQYGHRATFLSRLSSVTTKRLRQYRLLTDANKNKRKADVQVSDLESLLISRVNPAQEFAQELLSLDPSQELFLKEYFVGGTYDWKSVQGGTALADSIKEKVHQDIASEGIYTELLKQSEEKRTALSALLASYKAKEDERNAYFRNLQEKYGSRLVSKWSSNLTEYEFTEDQQSKGRNIKRGHKKSLANQVPFETKKPQGSTKEKKPEVRKPLPEEPPKVPKVEVKRTESKTLNESMADGIEKECTRFMETRAKTFKAWYLGDAAKAIHQALFDMAKYKQGYKVPAIFRKTFDLINSTQGTEEDIRNTYASCRDVYVSAGYEEIKE